MSATPAPGPRISYVVSAYFGARPRAQGVGGRLDDRVASLLRHVDRLAQLDVSAIDDVLFVVNLDAPDQDGPPLVAAVESVLVGRTGPAVRVLCRPNRGYSYGAWQAGIHSMIDSDRTHFFLIEDDYLPAIDRFYEPFLARMDAGTAFVGQGFAHFPGTNPPNADVSNGLLSADAARVVHQRFRQVFGICDLPLDARDYDVGCQNQVTYLALIGDAGFASTDIAGEWSVPFHWLGDTVIERGRAGGVAPLVPADE